MRLQLGSAAPIDTTTGLKEAQVETVCDACMCTCAEECVQSMQIYVLEQSRPLSSQTVALTFAFHIFLLRLKDDYWGSRKVFMR